jgi:predicted nucleic acid-binding protein
VSKPIFVADTMALILRLENRKNDIPELHDRIIAGTALKAGAKLITNDPIIARSKFVENIW